MNQKEISKSDKDLKEAFMKTVHDCKVGGDGGTPFRDDPATVGNGRISGIILKSGTIIDSIQVKYGGLPGMVHGGKGGNPNKEIVIPEGYDIIRIHVWSGMVIDRLEFVYKNSITGDIKTSGKIGGTGGTEKVIKAPDGLVLREIRGYDGIRVDSLIFSFGHPYFIDNLKIDEKYVEEALRRVKPISINEIDYSNIEDVDLEVKFDETEKRSYTSTFDWHSSTTITAGLTINLGIGKIMEQGSLGFSVSEEITVGKTTSKTEEFERHTELPVICRKKSRTIAHITITEAKLEDVPFTYNINFYRKEKDNIVKTVKGYGTFKGCILSDKVAVPPPTIIPLKTENKVHHTD